MNRTATVVPASTCAVCGKSRDEAGELAERSFDGKLACNWCFGKAPPYPQAPEPVERYALPSTSPGETPNPVRGPGPGGRSSSTDPVELYEWIALYNVGKLKPVEVELGPLPARARHNQRAAHANIALLMGLRLAEEDERALPCAASFAAEQLRLAGTEPKKKAARIIDSLVFYGCIVEVGEMKKRGKGNGTKLYAPPGGRGVDLR